VEIWEPSFTYHGFRYVQVEGWPGKPSPENLVGRVVHSDVGERGSFACSNDLINRIIRMVRWTEKSNLHSIPTDCPQRDERMGWLNDMAARSEELVYNFGAERLLAKFMADVADTQDQAGAITDTAPYRWGRRPADPISVCYLLVPWLLYMHHGDRRLMSERYAGMKRWVDFLEGQAKDGCVEYSWYGDWSPPVRFGVEGSLGSSAVSRDTPGALVSTACLAYSARLLAQIAQVLGKNRDATRYFRIYERSLEAFNTRFWDEEAGGYGKNNQAANAIALYMNVVPPERIDRTAQSLVGAVEREDYHLSTGNVCTKYLLEALAASGRADVALRIVQQETYPSWGFMLANGATTLWERWEQATGGGMNSHNHPMMGSVGAWFYRSLAGIRAHPAAPGFAEFTVRPEVLEGLDWTRCSLETVRGKVEMDWEKQDGDLFMRVVVPVNCTARVGLPVEGWSPMYEGETLVWQDEQPVGLPEGVEGLRREGDRVVITLGSGEYRLRTKV
jgi:alpha-L-rhamnosidase